MFEAHSREDRSLRNARLLVAIMLRHPEVGTVNYDHRNCLLRISFLIRRFLTDEEYQVAADDLRNSLEAFFYIDNRSPAFIEISRVVYGDLTVVELVRDIRSVSVEEVNVAVDILRNVFKESLVADRSDPGLEEDPFYHEELVEELMDDLARSGGDQHLIAIREEGRVIVFNK